MSSKPENILIKEYNYELLPQRIAEFPLTKRDHSKLLVYEKGQLTDTVFTKLPDFLPGHSTLIFNDTKVIEARLFFQKSTGGVIEIFCLEPHQQPIEQAMQQTGTAIWKCFVGGASKWKRGQLLEKQIQTDNGLIILSAKYLAKEEDSFLIEFSWQPSEISFINMLHAAGAIPLPPYIKRVASEIDGDRYQTIFSRHDGSVAAPTAALHFSRDSFAHLKTKHIHIDYVTLHVGAGTFKPVKTDRVAAHQMHSEPFSVKKETIHKLINAETVIAVGTTSLRTLESLYWLGVKLLKENADEFILEQWDAYRLADKYRSIRYQQVFEYLIQWMEKNSLHEIHCRTSLLIMPGYKFKIPVGLITNFHQPQSTLLLLVAAFIGQDWKKIYQHALENNYRFLSYGDSSLLWRM